MVRGIAAGERLGAVEDQPVSGRHTADQGYADLDNRPGAQIWRREAAQRALSSHRELTRLLEQRILPPDDALKVAHAIDRILGRYLTGTRYAVP